MRQGWAFDLDGTLVDTMPTLEALALRIFADLAPHVPASEVSRWYRLTSGRPFSDQLMDRPELTPIMRQTIGAQFELVKHGATQGCPAIPQMVKLFLGLRERGHQTAIITSSMRKYAQRFVRDHVPEDGLALFLGGIERGNKKAQLQSFRDFADTVTFVGDSEADRVFAEDAGVHFISTGAVLQIMELSSCH